MNDLMVAKNPLRASGGGVRLKSAKDFTGFGDSDKRFREAAASAGVNPNATGEEGQRRYLPHEIRKIFQHLNGEILELKPSNYVPPRIVVRITKGGTGKTTVCANAGVGLAMQGIRTLMIDADSQGSLSVAMGYDINGGIRFDGSTDKERLKTASEGSLAHIGTLLQRISQGKESGIAEAIVPVYANGMLDLLPANITLANEFWMMNVMSRETLFQRLLQEEREFFSQYEAIVIDCAPGTSMIATTIMAAADIVTAVTTPEPQAMLGLLGLENNLWEINQVLRQGMAPIAMNIIINDFRASMEPHKAAEQYLATHYGAYLTPVSIRSFVGFKREVDISNLSKSVPLLESDPTSAGAKDIMYLLRHELIPLYSIKMFAEAASVPATISKEAA